MTGPAIENTIETQSLPPVITSKTFFESLPEGKSVTSLSDGEIRQVFEKLGVEYLFDEFYKIIGLFGSTHGAANWREEAMKNSQDPLFDPKLKPGEWNDSFSDIEAMFKRICGTVIYRLENKDTVNGSLGSMAEVTMNAMLAYLFGQKQLVSLEENFERTLTTPGAIVQFYTMLYVIEHMQRLIGKQETETSAYVKLTEGNDVPGLMAQSAQELDALNPNQNLDHGYMLSIYEDPEPMVQGLKNNSRVVITGSGDSSRGNVYGIAAEVTDNLMQSDKNVDIVKFNTGSVAEEWNKLYGDLTESLAPDNIRSLTDTDYDQIKTTIFKLLDEQFDETEKADLVVNIITSKELSKGAITISPAIMLSHLYSGNDFIFLCEPLDTVICLRKAMKNSLNSLTQITSFEEARDFFEEQMGEAKLMSVPEANYLRSIQKLKSFLAGEVNWKTVIDDRVLQLLPEVIDVDSSMRARKLVQSDWRRLKSDFPGLPYFEDKNAFMEYMKKYIGNDETGEKVEYMPIPAGAKNRLKFEFQGDVNDLISQTRVLHAWDVDGLKRRLQAHITESIAKIESSFEVRVGEQDLMEVWNQVKESNLAKGIDQRSELVNSVLEQFIPVISTTPQ